MIDTSANNSTNPFPLLEESKNSGLEQQFDLFGMGD
jgi:hypothetical protein